MLIFCHEGGIMTNAFEKITLGSTGLTVGPLGLAASYGAPARAFEEAFEKGCNYFYLGSGRRSAGMKEAIRNLVAKGYREKMVIAIHTYARFGLLTNFLFQRALDKLNIDHADITILGWHNKPPSNMLLDKVCSMKANGLTNFIGMSGHNRSLFPKMTKKDIFDVFHIRYNAAHRGAEKETFPFLKQKSPGVVTYTATRWGQLLKPKHMPEGESPLKASDCYRFVLSNTDIDVCLCGPKNRDQMNEALSILEMGQLESEEIQRIKTIGDHVHRTAKSFF